MPQIRRLLSLAVFWLALAGPGAAASALSIDSTFVGNPGNACDSQPQGCFGAVPYAYSIATTEVTNGQYVEFLNAVADTDANGLYNANMGSGFGGITQTGSAGSFSYAAIGGRESLPVNFVSWYDALRFANWMQNGQPDTGAQTAATTEGGSYTFLPLVGLVGSRNAGATIVLASEDEWYKAAYYDALTTSYFDSTAGSNSVTTCTAPTAAANSANCDAAGLDAADPDVDDLTNVGSFTGSASPYGTFDQGGNVWEWNEAIIADDFRGLRGGSYLDDPSALVASTRGSTFPTVENSSTGFRIAIIPEPGTGLLLMLGLIGCASRARRSAARGLPAVAFALLWVGSMPGPVQAQEERPWTIPALQEWTPAAGTFEISPASRIVVVDAALLPVAEVFSEDLNVLLGYPVTVVGAPAVAGAGDVSLGLGELDGRLGHEGYRLVVGSAAEITAIEKAGVFYGTRTVLQLLHQGSEIPAGEALDWPRYPERGLMVDHGRKHFTVDWFEQHIKELAYLKLNYLHLHFTDNEGWRIESDVHPEVVSPVHLSKDEVSELVVLASRYHITVVPEIDMPGHMGAALAPHPEFQLTDSMGQKAPNNLDVTNPLAVQFARELVEEYLPLFPGPYLHSGGEEYLPDASYSRYPQLEAHAQAQYGPNAIGRDAVLGFMNSINDLVRSHGKTNRIWHDGISGGSAVTADPSMIVEWWTDFIPIGDLLPPDPEVFLEQGHTIMNASYWPLYYTIGGAIGLPEGLPPRVDPCSFYEEWEVNEFQGAVASPAVACQTVHALPTKFVSADEPRNLGAKLHVWGDTPSAETEDEVAQGIAPRLRIVAQKTWGATPLTASYAEFGPIMDATGHAPGFGVPSGTEVGFWAQQNASALDPEVLDVLADAGGSIYLYVDYLTDYGPGATSTFARDATLAANQRGVPVNAWLLAPIADGLFAHENNADEIQAAVQDLPAWAAAEGLVFREVTLDLEFPIGNEAVFDAFLGGDPTALQGAMQSNVDPVHQCAAIATYRDTISWAHENGIRITGSPAPFYLDDLADGFIALQDTLDGVAFPPLGYDALYLQAYRTYSNAGPGYVAEFFRDMQAEFGASGQVSLGDTQQGAPYESLQPLVDDVRMLAGMGATRIPIFELGGTVDRFGIEGLRAIVEAAGQPMSVAELGLASAEQPYDRAHRDFFQQLDTTAVALTNVVTAPPGEPDGPNAYPEGCGDPYAAPLPEPATGLGWLAALPLLAWLRGRRRSRKPHAFARGL